MNWIFIWIFMRALWEHWIFILWKNILKCLEYSWYLWIFMIFKWVRSPDGGGARAADHRATTVDNLTASDGVSAMAMQISVFLAMALQIEQLVIEDWGFCLHEESDAFPNKNLKHTFSSFFLHKRQWHHLHIYLQHRQTPHSVLMQQQNEPWRMLTLLAFRHFWNWQSESFCILVCVKSK